MSTKININIESDDLAILARIHAALNPAMYKTLEVEKTATPDDAGPDYGDGPGYEGYSERAGESLDADRRHIESKIPASQGGTMPDPEPDAERKVDTKGVPFHSDFCGVAADPFYSTGKRAGQWKKRKGVTDGDYDFWYTGKLSELDEEREERGEDESDNAAVITAAAFAGGGKQKEQAAITAPKDTGSLMAWVSEKQAAGLLTQDDIAGAYSAAGVQITDLFPPNDAATIQGRIAQVYYPLANKAGA